MCIYRENKGGQIMPLTLRPTPPDSKSYLHLCYGWSLKYWTLQKIPTYTFIQSYTFISFQEIFPRPTYTFIQPYIFISFSGNFPPILLFRTVVYSEPKYLNSQLVFFSFSNLNYAIEICQFYFENRNYLPFSWGPYTLIKLKSASSVRLSLASTSREINSFRLALSTQC